MIGRWGAAGAGLALLLAGCTGAEEAGAPSASPTVAVESPSAGLSPDIALKAAAVRGDHGALAGALQAGADVNASPGGSTALHVAARLADAQSVRLLLDAGADVGATDPYGATPLQVAAHADGGEVIDLLIDAGADPDGGQGYPYDARPIHVAASTGNLSGLEALVARGADLGLGNGMSKYAIDYAACHGQVETLRWLVDQGQLVGREAYACARDELYYDAADYLDSLG